MKRFRKIPILLICFVTIFMVPAGAEDDFQYWSRYSIKAVDTKHVDYINFWDIRFYPDAGRAGFWLTSQKLQFDFVKNISFVAAHTYIESRTVDSRTKDSEFKFQHRFELEANPYWQIKKWLKIISRNRIEFRWIEDKGSDNARFRQAWELETAVPDNPVLKSIYTGNEMFVDFNLHTINENWVTPIGLNLKICKKSSLKVFYMIQSKKGARDWLSNQILGTQVSIAF